MEFARIQREHGRSHLPSNFVAEWAAHRDYAKSLLSDGAIHGRVRHLAEFIAHITYSVATFARQPISQFVSYYPYADVGILRRFMKRAPKSFRSQVRKAAEGAYLMLLALDDFEHSSWANRVKNVRESFDRSVARSRLEQLVEATDVCRTLLTLVADAEAREPSLPVPCQSAEGFAIDSTQESTLVHFTGFPQSRFHDEMAFLRTIHVSEFCFIGIRLLTEETRLHVEAGHMQCAAECLRHANGFADVLHKAFLVLRTMPPAHFAEFRGATGRSSAVQSVNYQRMDVALHGFNPFKTTICDENEHLTHIREFAHPEYRNLRQLIKTVRNGDGESIIQAARQLDVKLKSWRGLHVAFAKAYLPPQGTGTGNTEGAAYLKHVLSWGIFDDTPIDYQLIASTFPEVSIDRLFRVLPGIQIAPPDDARQ
jgi:tryptophan 2,3-dioxygenase